MSVVARIPIRWRLALAFAVAMAALLAATGAFVYARLGSSLDKTIDEGLRARSAAVVALVQAESTRGKAHKVLVGSGETFAQVVDARGQVVATTALPGRVPLLSDAEVARALAGPIRVESVPGTDSPARLLAVPTRAGGRRVVVVVGTSLENREEAVGVLVVALLIGGPLALALASVAGYLLAAFALRPVESMRRQAAEITEADTGRRLPVPPARDEIQRLGVTLNAMLDRLEDALERERRFVADASHELRTPLGMLRTELELALRRERSGAELREALVSALEETERLARLAEDLLVLARADRGTLPLRLQPVRPGSVLERIRQRYEPRAARAGRDLAVNAAPELELIADEMFLEQALGNLVENGLRYGAGTLELEAVGVDGTVELHVVDEGAGFPAAFLDRAFERFARADDARTGQGSGLGLAIVQVIARAHGGNAFAANRPAGGADVWLVLPVNRSG